MTNRREAKSFTERSGVMVMISNDSHHSEIDHLVSKAENSAPWRGGVIYLVRSGNVTIAATGDADVHDDGRHVAICHGRLEVTDAAPAAEFASVLNRNEGSLPGIPPGAYSAIVLDRKTNQVWTARSVGGARPLAWTSGKRGWAAATEPRQSAILATGEAALDPEVGARYKTLQPQERTATFHKRTKWMTPGTLVHLDSQRNFHLSIRQPKLTINSAPLEEHISGLRTALRQSIQSALAGAGTVGSMATGGLDSSSLIGYAAQQGQIAIATSTAVHGVDGSLDEARLAETSLGTLVDRHIITEVAISHLFDGLLELIPTVEPPAGVLLGLMTTGYQTVADQGANTTLDGIGGDELFGLDLLRDAVSDHDLRRTANQLWRRRQHYRHRPRSLLGDFRKIVHSTGTELLSPTNHARWIWNRYNNWRLQVDGVARNRMAASLGIRLETPYLDERVLVAAATVPVEARLPDRGLQREVVSDVLAHAHDAIKIQSSDAQIKHYGKDLYPATAAAKVDFYRHFTEHHGRQ